MSFLLETGNGVGWGLELTQGDLGFLVPLASLESTCQSGDARDTGSVPGSGRFPGEGNGNKEPNGLQSIGSKRVRRD